MTDNPGQAPAGWYPDPSGSPRQRYFDGTNWTEHYHDEAAAAAGPGVADNASAQTISYQAGASYDATPGYQTAASYQAVPAKADMSPIDYWKSAMTEKYADFSGRARRAEYWWTTLVNAGGFLVLFIIAAAIAPAAVIVVALLYLAILIPSIALTFRRLHDTNKSGWWLLITIIPFGGIVLLVFTILDGDRGPNQYGPSPKY